MFSKELVLLSVLFASSNAFWWTSSASRPVDNDNIETSNVKQIPVGYFRFYTYHPVLPVAAARSFIPYQGVQKYVNEPLNWPPRPQVMPQTATEVKAQNMVPIAKEHIFVPPAAPILQNQNIKQSQSPQITTKNLPIEETTVMKIVPTTTTTSTAAPITISSAPSESSLGSYETSNQRIDISEPPSPSSYVARDPTINAAASAHVPLPPYSQPLPDPMHLPYLPTYQNPHVQYMPCMCPVSVASEVLPHKTIESREDTFDVNLSDDFE